MREAPGRGGASEAQVGGWETQVRVIMAIREGETHGRQIELR